MIAKTPRHLRVFLSSPGDLKAERDAAGRVLEELPRVHAWKGKFTIDPVRWDDPHAPAPMDARLTPQDAVNRGLPKPSECDIVVVILWGRMGTPLPGSYKKPNGDPYVSGTEWEYEDAERAGKPILLYRCTEKPLHIDDPAFEEKRRQYRLVGEFFKRFEAPDGSLTGGYTGYATTAEFTNRFRQDMEGLLRRWDDEPSEQKDLGPPLNFAPLLDVKRQHFCGREWLFEEINAWRPANDERALLITGDPGAGKSSIVAELITRKPDRVLAYHFCQADTGDTLQPGRFVRSVAAMLASGLPKYAAALEQPAVAEALEASDADPRSAFERGVLAPLSSLGAPPRDGDRYLLVDALDEALLGGERGLTIVDVLARRLDRLPPWLRLVATSRKERGVLDRLKDLRFHMLNAQDPRNLADLDKYVARRLETPRFKALLAASGADPARVRRILKEKSDGNFLYAQQALQGIERELYDPVRLDALPPGLKGLYGHFFARQYPDEAAYAVPRRALELILAAREPLNEAQLAPMVEIEPAALGSALAGLWSYLQETEGRLALYHKSLADWLTEARGAGRHFVDPEKGHERLLVYCRRWREGNDDYAFRHFPAHLAEARAVDELRALLLDGTFLKAQIGRLGDPFVEADNFTTLVAALLATGRDEEVAPLAVTESPYRRDGVVLALEAARREPAPRIKRIERIVRTLLSKEDSSRLWPWPGEPSAAVVGARRAAVRVACTKGTLLRAAEDPSPAVRGALVPYLFRFWEDRREQGWKLLARLCKRVSGRFGLPDRVALDIAGGVSLAILGAHAHDDAEVLAPLRRQWQLSCGDRWSRLL